MDLTCVLFYPKGTCASVLDLLRESIKRSRYRLIDWQEQKAESGKTAIGQLFEEVKRSRRVVLLLSDDEGEFNANLFYEYGFAIGYNQGVKRANIDGPQVIAIVKRNQSGSARLPFNVRALEHLYFDDTDQSREQLVEGVSKALKKQFKELTFEYRQKTIRKIESSAFDKRIKKLGTRFAGSVYRAIELSSQTKTSEKESFLEQIHASIYSLLQSINMAHSIEDRGHETLLGKLKRTLENLVTTLDLEEISRLAIKKSIHSIERITSVVENAITGTLRDARLDRRTGHQSDELAILESIIDNTPSSPNELECRTDSWIVEFSDIAQFISRHESFKQSWNSGGIKHMLFGNIASALFVAIVLMIFYLVGTYLEIDDRFKYFPSEQYWQPLAAAFAIWVVGFACTFTPLLTFLGTSIKRWISLLIVLFASMFATYLSKIHYAEKDPIILIQSSCSFIFGGLLFYYLLLPIKPKEPLIKRDLITAFCFGFIAVALFNLCWVAVLALNKSENQVEFNVLVEILNRSALYGVICAGVIAPKAYWLNNRLPASLRD